jgi:hypothetical protein
MRRMVGILVRKLSVVGLAGGAMLLSAATAAASVSVNNMGGHFDRVTADSHNGYIDVFASDGWNTSFNISFRTWIRGFIPRWTNWQNIGSPPGGSRGACSAVSVWNSHGQVWTRGSDGNAWAFTVWNGVPDAGGWQSIGAPPPGISGCPRTVSWGEGRLDVFVTGGDKQLWHTWFAGGWAGWWEPLGGTIDGEPHPVSSAFGQLDVFVMGTDHSLWDMKWNGSDSPNAWKWWDLHINTHQPAGVSAPMGAMSGIGTTLGLAALTASTDTGKMVSSEYVSGSFGPVTAQPPCSDPETCAADLRYFSVYRGGTRVDAFYQNGWTGELNYRTYDRSTGGWTGSGVSIPGTRSPDLNGQPIAVTTSGTVHVFFVLGSGDLLYVKVVS